MQLDNVKILRIFKSNGRTHLGKSREDDGELKRPCEIERNRRSQRPQTGCTGWGPRNEQALDDLETDLEGLHRTFCASPILVWGLEFQCLRVKIAKRFSSNFLEQVRLNKCRALMGGMVRRDAPRLIHRCSKVTRSADRGFRDSFKRAVGTQLGAGKTGTGSQVSRSTMQPEQAHWIQLGPTSWAYRPRPSIPTPRTPSRKAPMRVGRQ